MNKIENIIVSGVADHQNPVIFYYAECKMREECGYQ